jgi:hypothetical protein
MLAGLLKKVAKAASKTATKSEANAARKAIRANPKMKGEKEEAAIAKITQAEKKNIDAIVKRGEDAKPKKKGDRSMIPPAKRKQSGEERARAATGRVSAKTTTQQNKKEGVGSMVSYTSMERGKAIDKAGRDLRAGRITQAEHDRIIKAIERENKREVSKGSRRASQNAADMKAKTPTTREAPFPIPAKAKGVKGLNMNKGGYANCGASVKATQQSTNMSYGGMARKR